jgi:hypothetical protein
MPLAFEMLAICLQDNWDAHDLRGKIWNIEQDLDDSTFSDRKPVEFYAERYPLAEPRSLRPNGRTNDTVHGIRILLLLIPDVLCSRHVRRESPSDLIKN